MEDQLHPNVHQDTHCKAWLCLCGGNKSKWVGYIINRWARACMTENINGHAQLWLTNWLLPGIQIIFCSSQEFSTPLCWYANGSQKTLMLKPTSGDAFTLERKCKHRLGLQMEVSRWPQDDGYALAHERGHTHSDKRKVRKVATDGTGAKSCKIGWQDAVYLHITHRQ